MTLAEYHQLKAVPVAGGSLYIKAGARGFPDPQYDLLAQKIEVFGNDALDLNPGVGVVTQALAHLGLKVRALETSKAAYRCLEASFSQAEVQVEVGLPWETTTDSADLVALVLPANRGSQYVELSLHGATNALRMGGRLWIAGSKDKGFEHYFKKAQALLGFGVLVGRKGEFRVAVLEKEKPTPPLGQVWESFQAEARGQTLEFCYLPGVFSAGHIDPGTQMLLDALPDDLGHLLDIGGGYGGLSLPLLPSAKSVTLLEDDWVSVLRARANLDTAKPKAPSPTTSIFHSDVDQALTNGATFTTVASNPPFHVGGVVVLETARAFLETAHARLERGGKFYLVANRFLPYEPLLEERFSKVQTLAVASHKVLLAQK